MMELKVLTGDPENNNHQIENKLLFRAHNAKLTDSYFNNHRKKFDEKK